MSFNSDRHLDFFRAILGGSLSEVETYLVNDPQFLDRPEETGWTGLHFAISRYDVEEAMLKLLLRHSDRRINFITNAGFTPLHRTVVC